MDLLINLIETALNYAVGIVFIIFFAVLIIENWPDSRFNALKSALHELIKE